MSGMLRAPRKASRALRSATSLPPNAEDFIGSSISELPPGKLPSVKDVLQLICHYREQPKASRKGVSDFCCSSQTASKEAGCLKVGGCVEEGAPCLAFKVKRPYLQAGFVTLSDQAIERHLKKISEELVAVKKLKARSTGVSRQVEYEREILKTLNILDPNARTSIMNDANRSEAAKQEDLRFYDDFFGPAATRRMCFTVRDRGYDAAVEKCVERQKRKQQRQEREAELREREDERQREEQRQREQSQPSDFGEESPEENGNDDEWESQDQNDNVKKRYRQRKRHRGCDGGGGDGGGDDGDDGRGEVGVIPYEIIAETTATAVRIGLSHGQHLMITAAILKCSSLSPTQPQSEGENRC